MVFEAMCSFLIIMHILGLLFICDARLNGMEGNFAGGHFGHRPNIFDITGLPGTDLLSSTVITLSFPQIFLCLSHTQAPCMQRPFIQILSIKNSYLILCLLHEKCFIFDLLNTPNPTVQFLSNIFNPDLSAQNMDM
jgi:hypothetical protein